MSDIDVDVHVTPEELAELLRNEARQGLSAPQKWLSPKFLYDERGSQLFDEITQQPEYYLTRSETSILAEQATAIARATGADTLVELGSGTSTKTRILLDALRDTAALRRFVPFDVSETTLRDAARAIAVEYPGVAVHAIVGDFNRHLGLLPSGGTRLVAFLGSTLGNLLPEERAPLLAQLAATLVPGDTLLLGIDLIKGADRLELAYDDPAGITAQFNRNILDVIDRELGADFDARRFDHRARFRPEHDWVELALVAREEQHVTIGDLGMEVDFAPGEALFTEVSTKFTRGGITAELAAAGFAVGEWWTDEPGDFALCLAAV